MHPDSGLGCDLHPLLRQGRERVLWRWRCPLARRDWLYQPCSMMKLNIMRLCKVNDTSRTVCLICFICVYDRIAPEGDGMAVYRRGNDCRFWTFEDLKTDWENLRVMEIRTRKKWRREWLRSYLRWLLHRSCVGGNSLTHVIMESPSSRPRCHYSCLVDDGACRSHTI